MSKLFRGKNFGYLSTLMKDGSPQVIEISVDIEDGNIIVNTAEEHIDKLAKKYLGVDKKNPTELRSPDEKRIIVRIKPEKATYQTRGPPG